MPTKKKQHLKIEIIEAKGYNKALVRVVSQSHRGKEFGNNGEFAANGFVLASKNFPQRDSDGYLFLRGAEKEFDNDTIVIDTCDIEKLIGAVKEYNNQNNVKETGNNGIKVRIVE